MMQSYSSFLRAKIDIAPKTGIKITAEDVNPALLPHQRDAVIWAVRGGRRALFESFGLGKTIQALEWCHIITEKKGGQALIVLPLGVKQEFKHDAKELLGYGEPPYVRNMDEVRATDAPILLTNYERVRDGDIAPGYFTATSLDEAAVLRSFGSKTYQTFLDKFKGVPFKLVNTATPSPNRYKELIHYAGYLEIMDTGQALTRFFKRDSKKAGNLQLYEGREMEFWTWLASWALFITKPSDLGYDDTGYNLPEMKINYHCLSKGKTIEGSNGQLSIAEATENLSLKQCAKEKRESIDIRVAKAKEIIDTDPDNSFIIWHDLEAERHALKKAIPEMVDIYGSQDYDKRERRVIDFQEGRTRIFGTKKALSGSGCNFQKHCHRAIFLGIDYEFNDFIQAIHRIYRFLQTERVIIDVIYTEKEKGILEVLKQKWRQHEQLTETMTAIIRKHGLSDTGLKTLQRKIGVKRVQVKGQKYTAILNDCVEETRVMPDNSIDLIHTSIPFSNHYEYSPNYNDFGHNANTEKFFEQMDYLTPELLRILRPGRVAAIHVKDRVLFGSQTGTGMPTIEPFHAMCISHYIKHGFMYFGMITVITDVVRENNQTYRLGWTEQCKDGTKMGVGCEEYILLFRKLPTDTSRAYADEPVVKSKEEYTRGRWQLDAHGFWRSSGDRLVTKEELMNADTHTLRKLYHKYSSQNVYNYGEHVKLANELDKDDKLPATFMVIDPASWNDKVWDDINRMRTLNSQQARRKQTLHICPLQIDIVERIIDRYSNKGDVVFDPFAGLFTVPYIAAKMERYGVGTELNEDSFRDGLGYLKTTDENKAQFSLFDLMEAEQTLTEVAQ